MRTIPATVILTKKEKEAIVTTFEIFNKFLSMSNDYAALVSAMGEDDVDQPLDVTYSFLDDLLHTVEIEEE